MAKNIEQVKSDIRALLNLAANDAATEGEIENAMRFARRYMIMYNLTEDDCKNENHIDLTFLNELEMDMVDCDGDERQLASWEGCLAVFVGTLIGSVATFRESRVIRNKFGGVQYTDNGKPKQRYVMVFYGPKGEIVIAKEIYERLCSTITSLAYLKYGTVARGPGRSYGDGFVAGLYKQIEKADEEIRRLESNGNALVVRSNAIAEYKCNLAKDWIYKEKGYKFTKVFNNTKYYHHAYNDGMIDGKKANINQQKTNQIGGSVALLK